MNTAVKAAPLQRAITEKATSKNRNTSLAGLTVNDRCLVKLLQVGSYGLTNLDLIRQDDGCLFWTDQLHRHVTRLRKRFAIISESEPVQLPDNRRTRRTRYRLKDRNEAQKAIEQLNKGPEGTEPIFSPAESARLLKLHNPESNQKAG